MAQGERESKAEEPQLIVDPDAIARKEAENAVLQFDAVLDLIDEVVRDGRPFRLRSSKILGLHEIALRGISAFAGSYRPGAVEIGQSKHLPPDRLLVPDLVDDMCDWVNDHWEDRTALQLCAYIMWRLNWIHPFSDGNGRTSRAVAYFVLCARIGSRLPGRRTIPEQISEDKAPYYKALESADAAAIKGQIDTSDLEELLETYLATQLTEVFDNAKGLGETGGNNRRFH